MVSADLENGKDMIFLDKIYLSIYRAYKFKFKDSVPESYGIMYLSLMISMHIMALIKILIILGVPIDLKNYTKTQEYLALAVVFGFVFIRYFFLFDPVAFEKKHGFSNNYKPLIIYTVVFFVSFWVLILNF